MSFEKIGPYELTRGDNVVAALVVSFVTGARSARWTAAIIILIGVIMSIEGISSGSWWMIAAGPALMIYLFVVMPALRSRKGNRDIFLDYSPEGLVAETNNVRTVYKWAAIRSAKIVGSRLFIMISDNCALVVSNRSTSLANMERLNATVVEHLRADIP
jgi:hypothetical protein